MQEPATPSRRSALPAILLALLILGYAAFFSAYTLQRHATFNTFAADLSFIDQPMWNTLHGRFLERTLGAIQAPRVAEHFEPILLPLSLVYLVWNDVRAMLIVQTLALALGALPVFWIARRTFSDQGTRAPWIALAFSLACLLAPSLQAANVADFHADPLVVTPLLFAFWYGTERRWRPMWAWAILVMAGKENLPTLTAMLGLYFILTDPAVLGWVRGIPRLRESRRLDPPLTMPASDGAEESILSGAEPRGAERSRRTPAGPRASSGGAKHGLALIVVSVAWFLVATFAIVAPLARQVYGTDGPIYLENRYELGGRLLGTLGGALGLLAEPARLDYLGGLLGAVGWLALLAPEVLLIGLPVLIANTFSNYPGQYSGEQHYSAPLVPVFVVAAIYGARRLQKFFERQVPFRLTPLFTNAVIATTLIAGWLVLQAGVSQVNRGWTPVARQFQWPARTAHHATLDRLASQIPAGAPVSATSAVHPHLAHREKIYVFSEVGDATHVLVDVTGGNDMQATDLKAAVERLVREEGFGIVDAADGYILLAKGAGAAQPPDAAQLPPDFYTFAKTTAAPQYPVEAQFGPGLRLIGYDAVDEPRWRTTRFRFYFERVSDEPLPADLDIRYTARDPAGNAVDDDDLRPMPATLWYPPSMWPQGETVVVETVPWYLPRAFAPVLTVTSGGQTVRAELAPAAAGLDDPAGGPNAAPGAPAAVAPDGSLRLPGLARRDGKVAAYEGALYPIEETDASFAGENWTVRLREWSAPVAAAPGEQLPVLLYWQSARPAPKDYNVFLHLRDATGKTVAMGDGQPSWFTPRPASQWEVGPDGLAGGINAHSIQLPADLVPGRYELVAGWYDWQTGERLSRAAGVSAQLASGNQAGDELVLGSVTVDPLAGPRPDACCLAAKECCASKE